MHEIGKLLPSVFRKQIRRAEPRLLEILTPLWPRIVGKPMAEHSQPAGFEYGVLSLSTDCATWGAQLRQMTEEIRAEVNSFLGQPAVRKLRIEKVARLGLLPRTDRSHRPALVPSTPEDAAVDTTPIRDPEVAQVVARSYCKYFAHQRR